MTGTVSKTGRDEPSRWHVERLQFKQGEANLFMLYFCGKIVGMFTQDEWEQLNRQVGLKVEVDNGGLEEGDGKYHPN